MDTSADNLIAAPARSNSPKEQQTQKLLSDSESSEKTLAESSSHETDVADGPQRSSPTASTTPSPVTAVDCSVVDVADSGPRHQETGRRASASFTVEDERVHSCHLCIEFCTNYNTPLGNTNIYKYLVTGYFMMLALSVSAAVMGVLAMESCPAIPNAPIEVFLIGLTGMFGFGGKLVEACHQLIERRPVLWFPRSLSISLFVAALILLIAEMIAISRTKASSDQLSANYCESTFYEYAFWMNYVAILLMLGISGLFFARACRTERESILPARQRATYLSVAPTEQPLDI